MERWRRVATSAAEQSGRAFVPKVDSVITLKQVVDDLGAPRADEMRIVAAEPSIDQAEPPASTPPTVGSVVVAVGPAGGLGSNDLAILSHAGFAPRRLALHTLRSETACIAAIAILADRFR